MYITCILYLFRKKMKRMTLEEVKKIIQKELTEYKGGAIENLFEEKGLSASDARTARRILSGERKNPGLKTISRILNALGYDVRALKNTN